MRRKDNFSGERSIVLPPMVIDMEKSDPLVSSLYVTDIGYYPHAEGHYRERKYPISENVLIYCVCGNGWFNVDDIKHVVSANQYFILPAGKPHAYGAGEDEPWTIYWVHFSGSHSGIYTEGALLPQDVMPGLHSRISHRNSIFEEMFNTLYGGFSRESLRYVSSLLYYYLASMRYLSAYRNAELATSESEVTTAAIHYMRENVEKRMALADLASYTGYSAGHFSALFRRQVGKSPMEYFNLIKMEEACRMLSNTDMHINQICHKVGMDDCYYFSRLFSKIIGKSPSEYRKNIAQLSQSDKI